VGVRAGLDTEARGRIFTSAGDRKRAVQSVVRHYTDSATPAPTYEITNHISGSDVPTAVRVTPVGQGCVGLAGSTRVLRNLLPLGLEMQKVCFSETVASTH
jgi:hypothetical protein